jgi:acetyl/propionyl-CoA carboxylase alpha subunit
LFKKLLIANRGEIVCRIIDTCKELDIKTVTVYSDADKGALFTRMSDEAFNIGPGNPMKSYLNIAAILDVAKKTEVDAIHPGYGFLSESLTFSNSVTDAGITWVGPPPSVLKAIESKCNCRNIAYGAGVPVTPGTLGPIQNVTEICSFGKKHGFPIFLKLDKGGGGKGIEMIREEREASEVFEKAYRIGLAAFNSSDCYIEKVLGHARHIEVQFLIDEGDNCICLGERECSIQRRYQKIIEESPSVVVTQEDREVLFEYTRRLARAMGYRGAGTMEFLKSESGKYYFMEINARLQVEHPVSEMITGVDIVKHQLRIAAGENLLISQNDIEMQGNAIEARIYAEDPVSFEPSPGKIIGLKFPEEMDSIRIDHALAKGVAIPPFYDPLLAKVISHGPSRLEAIMRLINALNEFQIEGVKTTIPSNILVLKSDAFIDGHYNTNLINELLSSKRFLTEKQ